MYTGYLMSDRRRAVILNGQPAECHSTFVRGELHIVWQDPHIDHKACFSTYPCSRILFENYVALKIKHSYEEQTRAYRISPRDKDAIGGKMEYCYLGTNSLWYGNWNRHVCRKWKCEVNRPSRSTGVVIVNFKAMDESMKC